MGKKLFPEFLNYGSQGPAVALLQCLLKDRELNDKIIVDGDYGPETARGVRELQTQLGVEQDGHFGPETRRVFVEGGGLDANSLEADLFVGETKEVKP